MIQNLERQYNQVKDRLAAHISLIQELEDRVGSQEALMSEKCAIKVFEQSIGHLTVSPAMNAFKSCKYTTQHR